MPFSPVMLSVLVAAASPAAAPQTAAAPPPDAAAARDAYADCLRALIKPALREKQSRDGFVARMKSSCQAQETAFRAAVVAEDKADGMADAAAQSDADDQVQDYLDKFSDSYEDYRSSNTGPA